MHRIEQEEYEKLRPITARLTGVNLNIAAVLDGNCPGEVYVDDIAQPRAAYLISGDGHYLAGSSGNHAFNRALNAALPRDHYFVLFCDPTLWEGALPLVLKDTYAVPAARRYYTLAGHKIPDWQARIPDGLWMERICPEFLARGFTNSDDVVGWILDGWHSVEAFLAEGFGFCLVRDGEIVSWSLVDYVHGDRCEMGIRTAWDYRRQGFGTLTAAATAAHATARGFSTIGWHCWANNVGSIGVAENVGFRKTVDYEVFINHWAAENISDMSQVEFRAFAASYERQFQDRPPTSGFPHIVTAKAWALGRDRKGCFRHLNRAVDLGWLRGVDHLREIWPEFFWRPDLDQMPEWQNLVRRFETDEPDHCP
jgi:RimJ/RimL family protein N-acetyltransferase